MRRTRPLLIAVVLGALAVAVAVVVLLGGDRQRLNWYQVAGDAMLAVEAEEGQGDWTRVTSVEETDDAVEITVKSLSVPFVPRPAIAFPIELLVELDRPLGDRTVLDGYSEVPLKESP